MSIGLQLTNEENRAMHHLIVKRFAGLLALLLIVAVIAFALFVMP
jgi:hypothetical protein